MADEAKTDIVLTGGKWITVEGTVDDVIGGIHDATTPHIAMIKLTESGAGTDVYVNPNQIVACREHRAGGWRLL